LRATATLRRWIFFWKGKPRTVEADESLAALLNRREQVRSKQTAPAERAPDLFTPKTPVVIPKAKEDAKAPIASPSSQETPATPPAGAPPVSTTSRLLDAKKRAKRKTD